MNGISDLKRPTNRPYYRLCALGAPDHLLKWLEEKKGCPEGIQLWEGERPQDVHSAALSTYKGHMPFGFDRDLIQPQWQMWEDGEWMDCDNPTVAAWR